MGLNCIHYPKKDAAPIYDLIIGIESLAELGAILNFADKSITIDHVVLPMKPHDQLMDPTVLQAQFQAPDEPVSTRDATKRAVEILDAKYEKADVVAIVTSTCKHLTNRQQQMLIELLLEFEPLFDGTLGDWNTKPATFKLKKNAKPYHGRAFPVPHIHLQVLKREVERLVRLGVLKRQPDSEWGSSAFIIPKKNGQVRFISDFREVNKRIIRAPYPIPKIATVLQQMEGFTFATSLDLIMGYYTIRLDSDTQKICTIILPWGKYSYMRLPMGVSCSADIFQEKMSSLMETLEYVRVYLDDLLTITRDSLEDHSAKLKQVLIRL